MAADLPRLLGDPERPLAAIRPGAEMLLTSHLMTGLGSSGLTFDRGMQGKLQQVGFERRGSQMTLVQRNKKWTSTGDAAAEAVGTDSFVRSVLWAAPIERFEGDDAVVDLTTLIVRDHLGIADHLRAMGEGRAVVDSARSFVDLDDCRSGDEHVELTGVVTFTVAEPGPRLVEVAPDPHALTFTMRLSLLALPVGFEPRVFDPRAGGYGKGFEDMGAVPEAGTTTLFAPRFRVDPGHAIVFNVDPGIPEPYRSAVVRGGAWWSDAFAAAGLPGAYRVRILPQGTDPFAVGTNMVWWVHRTGRGWSRAAASVDVRTGEIVHANVRLGSQRVHQLTALLEALLSPWGRPDERERVELIRETVVRRVEHLAAHEIGHALGFVHNYASTLHEVPSVMDYPHPRLSVAVVDGREEIDLTDAYTPSLGDWDHHAVRRAYGDASDEASAELPFLSDLDGHGPDAATPDAVPWTFGCDPLASLDTVVRVRSIALRDFGPGAIPPGRQWGDLEGRFFLAHLLHRHQVGAVARLIGGVSYRYGRAGDVQPGTVVVGAERQRAALDALLRLLDRGVIEVPDRIHRIMTPPSLRYARSADAIAPAAGPIFDPTRAAEAAAGVVLEPLLSAGRLNRVWDHHRTDAAVPAIAEIVSRAAQAAVTAGPGAAWAFARHAVRAASAPALHPWARDELRTALREVGENAEASPAASALRHWLGTGDDGRIGPPITLPAGAPL